VQNRTGAGHHDTQTGHPCSPDGQQTGTPAAGLAQGGTTATDQEKKQWQTPEAQAQLIKATIEAQGSSVAAVAGDKLMNSLNALHQHLEQAGLRITATQLWVVVQQLHQLEDPEHALILNPLFAVSAKRQPNPALAHVKDAVEPPNLTNGEKVAQQIYSYGGDGRINGALRREEPIPEAYQKAHEQLQRAMKKAKWSEQPITAVRGIDLPEADLSSFLHAALAAQRSGGVMELPGYTSTATGKKLAPGFKGNVKMHLKAHQGLDMMPVTHFPQEKELLLDHNSRFRVSEVKKDSKGVYHIFAEQVRPEEGGAEPERQKKYRGQALPAVEKLGAIGQLKALLGFILERKELLPWPTRKRRTRTLPTLRRSA
jgi:hypothetical protein